MKSQLIAQCNSWRIMTPCFHCAILYTTGHEISRGKRSCQVGSLAPFQLSHPHHRLNKWIHSRSFIAAETTEFPTAAPTITPLENARGGREFLRHGTECDLSTGSLCVTVLADWHELKSVKETRCDPDIRQSDLPASTLRLQPLETAAANWGHHTR